MNEITRATFRVRFDGEALVTDDMLRKLIRVANTPRPGQSYALRDLPERYAAEVVYLSAPDAPAHEVTYQQLAQAWADLFARGQVSNGLPLLEIREAAAVIDHVCAHLPRTSSPRRNP